MNEIKITLVVVKDPKFSITKTGKGFLNLWCKHIKKTGGFYLAVKAFEEVANTFKDMKVNTTINVVGYLNQDFWKDKSTNTDRREFTIVANAIDVVAVGEQPEALQQIEIKSFEVECKEDDIPF